MLAVFFARFAAFAFIVWVSGLPVTAQQTFTGRLSDSLCGASHQTKAAAGGLADRECLFACTKALATYVLVDENNKMLPIANQDAMGLPLYAGRPVKLTGERKGDAIFVTKVEAGIPAGGGRRGQGGGPARRPCPQSLES